MLLINEIYKIKKYSKIQLILLIIIKLNIILLRRKD